MFGFGPATRIYFDEPFGNIPGPFSFLLADLNGKIGPRRLDYSRTEGISNHDYVRKLLRQSIEELSSDPKLPDDDGSDCDKVLDEYWHIGLLSTEAYLDT
jgi:hypothetical protein